MQNKADPEDVKAQTDDLLAIRREDQHTLYTVLMSGMAQEAGPVVSQRLTDKLTANQIKHLIAGGVAGAVSRTSVSPLERMKILYQIQVEAVADRRFKGIGSSLLRIGREEGLTGYFKGNGTNVVRIVPYVAVQFAAYEEFKKLLDIPDDPRKQRPLKRLLAGALAGITSVSATYPLDLIRTRLSAQLENGQERKYKSIRHAFQTILREEGGFWSGCLYRGIFPTLTGIAPYVGLNFACYETLKGHVLSYLLDDTDQRDQVVLDNELPVKWKLMCGGISGAIAQTVTYPLDVLRRRMQMRGFMSEHYPYKNSLHAVATIYRTEGASGFYKGMLPNLLKVAPLVAITFVTYEFTKARLFGVPLNWR